LDAQRGQLRGVEVAMARDPDDQLGPDRIRDAGRGAVHPSEQRLPGG